MLRFFIAYEKIKSRTEDYVYLEANDKLPCELHPPKLLDMFRIC